MSVYKKLQEARCDMQAMTLKKSGHNKFAGYSYFELGDFLPVINDLFKAKGLCSVVSYTADLATLRVIDVEDGTSIEFTSPMGSAALKGCHEVQNIGAVETYQRRYLYVTALEIVEHDALDAVVGDPKQLTARKVDLKPKIDKAQEAELHAAIEAAGITEADLCKKVRINSIADLEASRFQGAMDYLAQQQEKVA